MVAYWFTPRPGRDCSTPPSTRPASSPAAPLLPAADLALPGMRAAGHRPGRLRRPAHAEHRHVAGCARLARDQAADATLRRDWLPRLILHSEPGRPGAAALAAARASMTARAAAGTATSTTTSPPSTATGPPRSGDCYADLHPDITVTVKFFSARWPGGSRAVRRDPPADPQRPRLPRHRAFPDIGQQMTWQLCWEHTPKLVEEAHGGADEDIAEISRAEAEQITAGLAARYWPPDAARLPWVASAYPE